MQRALWIIALAVLVFPVSAKADCTLVSSGETRPTGTIIHNANYNLLQVCKSDGSWKAMTPLAVTPPNFCTGTTGDPAIGDTCTDGSIYAGLSPDGNVPMYTTPADAPSTYTWNDGTGTHTDTSMANCTDGPPGTATTCQTGEANTAFLVGATGEPDYPFAAAEYCDGLSAHGHDDWYLPAQDEMDTLLTNSNSGDLNGTFDTSSTLPFGYYFSASEYNNFQAIIHRGTDGSSFGNDKATALSVRCVRK